MSQMRIVTSQLTSSPLYEDRLCRIVATPWVLGDHRAPSALC